MILQLSILLAALAFAAASSFPNGPFTTSGSWIVGRDGANVTYAGVNWPGHEATMVPEGLQYQSVETIVSRIKSLGMNSIRLTYATEMVDQIYENNMTDVPIKQAFVDALGQDNGTAIFNRTVANNPSFGASTTRLKVRSDGCMKETGRDELADGIRCTMPSRTSVPGRISTSTSTIMSRRHRGAVIRSTATPGGTTPTSRPSIGPVVFPTWQLT